MTEIRYLPGKLHIMTLLSTGKKSWYTGSRNSFPLSNHYIHEPTGHENADDCRLTEFYKKNGCLLQSPISNKVRYNKHWDVLLYLCWHWIQLWVEWPACTYLLLPSRIVFDICNRLSGMDVCISSSATHFTICRDFDRHGPAVSIF